MQMRKAKHGNVVSWQVDGIDDYWRLFGLLGLLCLLGLRLTWGDGFLFWLSFSFLFDLRGVLVVALLATGSFREP